MASSKRRRESESEKQSVDTKSPARESYLLVESGGEEEEFDGMSVQKTKRKRKDKGSESESGWSTESDKPAKKARKHQAKKTERKSKAGKRKHVKASVEQTDDDDGTESEDRPLKKKPRKLQAKKKQKKQTLDSLTAAEQVKARKKATEAVKDMRVDVTGLRVGDLIFGLSNITRGARMRVADYSPVIAPHGDAIRQVFCWSVCHPAHTLSLCA